MFTGDVYTWLWAIFFLLVFPGFLFLFFYGMMMEYVDRKLYAWLQNRVGPPWFQPEADWIKLMAKEDITPKSADGGMLYILPLASFAVVCASIFYIPIWSNEAIFRFEGDILLVAYFLSLPTIALFLIGWHSANLFTTVGAQRAMTQLFAYEVPLLLVIISPAILAGSWSISDITAYQMEHRFVMLFTALGAAVAMIMLQGKLERTPFDIPEAETEIVGGPLTELSGKKLAMLRLTNDVMLVVGAALIAALFLGGFTFGTEKLEPEWATAFNILLFIFKTLFIVFWLAALRALFARLRIDQMVDFSWSWMAPLAVLQLFLVIVIKYFDIVSVIEGWFT